MKKILSILFFTISIGVVFFACTKVADNPYYADGNVVALTANKTSVTATPADTNNNVITFNWTSPNYASTASTWKFLLEMDTSATFATKTTKEFTGVNTGSITGKEYTNMLLRYGIALSTAKDVYTRVISSYGNNNERYTSNVLKIAMTPFNNPAALTSEKTSVTGTLATAGNYSNTFSWNGAFNGYTGNVTYTLQYDSATKNFASPKEMPVGVNLYNKVMTVGDMNATALNSGIPGGNTGKVDYRIKAVTAQGAISYSNSVSVTIQSYIAIIRLYLPGGYQAATGNGNDWDPTTAPELIRDQRSGLFNNMYYTYVYLPANSEFKVTVGRDWAVNYGKGGTAGSIASPGTNFSVTTAGVYRFSIDINTMKYDIRDGRMGFVGGAVGAGWDPPSVFPNYALGYSKDNLFVGTAAFTADAWKLIDNNAWNNGSNAVDETRSYGSNGGSGSTMEVNGPNFPNSTVGRFRVIWDGRDPNNIKYTRMDATEMRLVGDGINQAGVNDWDPPSSPNMVWQGNGVWTLTVTLKANKSIKFLAGNAWGAFDYEDASGGSAAVGTPRKIQFEGGPDFKTPAVAGTYTITLNERTQTVTIN